MRGLGAPTEGLSLPGAVCDLPIGAGADAAGSVPHGHV